MPALRTETNSVLIYDPDKSRGTVHCSIAQPTPLEERMLGKLLLLVEVDSRDPVNHEVIAQLQKSITTFYYQSEDFQIESAFERALQTTNQRLQSVLGEQLAEWVKRSHVVIAVLKETTLHFTVIGRVHAFLVHKQRIVDIMASSTGATSEEVSPLKIFSQIVSGQLNLDDSLFFCTTSILDYLSQEKLKRLLSDQHPDDAARALEELLAEADAGTSFGAIIARLAAAPLPVEMPSASALYSHDTEQILKPQTSMEELIRREQKTNELLTHPLWPNVARLIRGAGEYAKSGVGRMMLPKSRKNDDHSLHHDTRLPEQRRTSKGGAPLLRTMVRGLGRALLLLFSALWAVVRWIAQSVRGSRVPKIRSISQRTGHRVSHGASWFQRLPSQRRRLLIIGVILILVFAESIVLLGKRQETQKNSAHDQQLLDSARQKVASADAALLIKNESGARTLLQQAQHDLQQIPATDKKLANDKKTAQTSIATRLETTRHSVTPTLTTVSDFSKLEVGFSGSAFTVSNGVAYTFQDRTGSVYRIDLTTKKSDVVVSAPSLASHFVAFVPGSSVLDIRQANGALQELNLTAKTLTTVPVAYVNADRDIRDQLFYNNKLYTLDAKNNQIFRHTKNGKGFGQGLPWVTDADVALSDARSFSADGALYVAKDNGQLVKLSGGKKTSVSFEATDPKLTTPTQVYTGLDVSNVYVLESSQHRVLEYTKTGVFVQQYVADKLGSAKAIFVQNNTVYFLSGTTLYQFPVVTTK